MLKDGMYGARRSWASRWRQWVEAFSQLFSSSPEPDPPWSPDYRKLALNAMEQLLQDFNVGYRPPSSRPVCRYLFRARANSPALEGSHSLHAALASGTGVLSWEWGYHQLPPDLQDRFAYAEIAGPSGPVYAAKLSLGLVLLGPGCYYPPHRHPGIAETYVAVSGRVSINGDILVPNLKMARLAPDQVHRLETGKEPCLLAYAWTGPVASHRAFSLQWS